MSSDRDSERVHHLHSDWTPLETIYHVSAWAMFVGFGIVLGAEGFAYLPRQPAWFGWAIFLPAAVVGMAAQLALSRGDSV